VSRATAVASAQYSKIECAASVKCESLKRASQKKTRTQLVCGYRYKQHSDSYRRADRPSGLDFGNRWLIER
jgi:hypothetical protein